MASIDPFSKLLRQTIREQGWADSLQSQRSLEQAWERAAGADLAEQTVGIRFAGGEVEIFVSGPGAATQVRFQARGILTALRANGIAEVISLRPRVLPTAGRRPQRHRSYSAVAADRICRQAESIPDGELRDAVQHLARTLAHPPTEGTGDTSVSKGKGRHEPPPE